MSCVGYNYKFEKYLARSLKGIKHSSSKSTKKCKTIAGDAHDTRSEGEDEVPEPDNPPPKCWQNVKGKAKAVKLKGYSGKWIKKQLDSSVSKR